MWIFLATEILFFGGMFTSYTIYRALHLPSFIIGSHLLEVKFGATNTAVLICSSLTMALAIRSAQTGKSKSTIIFYLILTMILGAAVSGAQASLRVVSRLCGAYRSRLWFSVSSRMGLGGSGSADVHVLLLFHDRPARAAYGGRPGYSRGAGCDGRSRKVYVAVLRSARDQRSLLALRRYRLDLPVPAAIPDWRALL